VVWKRDVIVVKFPSLADFLDEKLCAHEIISLENSSKMLRLILIFSTDILKKKDIPKILLTARML
jgi:hypothetical protein